MLNEDKQALLNGTARIRCKLIVKATDTLPEIILTEQNSVKDWVYNDERYVPQQGFIGQFVARTLEGNLQNISDDFNIENRELELQLGIVRNTTETWYSMGNFIVTDPEDNEVKDNTKFQAMDYTKLFNKRFDGDFTNSVYTASYNKLIETGSVTALWLAKYACAQVGVDFPQTSFTNSAFTINQNPFQAGESCRDVLKEISKLAYSWVRIGQDNKCYIDFNQVNDSSVDIHNVINKDTYYTLETKKTIYGPINNVVVGMSGVDGESHSIKDQASINQYGEHTLYIYDNPLTNTFELRELAQQQANKLFGLNYVHLEVETVGHPWLQGNERINVLDMEDENNFTYPFNKSLKYAGHIRSVINTMGESEVESTLAYESGFVKNIRNASLNVDKQNGKIEALIEDIEENNGIVTKKINTLQLDLNGTTSRVTTVEKSVTDLEGDIDKKLGLISEDIDGVQINLDEFIDNEYAQGISNLQKQIDGAIQFWNGPEIPTLNNYPTNQWTTENDKINHQADIYTVIEDIDGELKQGKSYRFDKVNGKWVWIELTDNELSAVQALAQEALDKAKQNEGDVVILKSDVSELKQTDEKITASVDSIENTLIPTADVSGSNIVLNDSTDASLVKFKIEGKSKQNTSSGINQLMSFGAGETSYFSSLNDYKNSNTDYWKAVPLADNWVHIECDLTGRTNTSESYTNFFISLDKLPNLKTGTTYTLDIEFRNVLITTMASYLRLGQTHGTADAVFTSMVSLGSTQISKNQMLKYTLKTYDTFSSNGLIALRNFHAVKAGDKFSYDVRLSVLEGDYTNKEYTYESFGVSPSPDYPSEIKSVGYQNLFKGEFRQGNILGQYANTRLTADDNYYIEIGKTYTMSSNAGEKGFKYGINTSTVMFPLTGGTQTRNYDSGWLTGSKFTFTAVASGYLGVSFARQTDTEVVLIDDIKDVWFVLTEDSSYHNYVPRDKYGVEIIQRNKNYYPNSGNYNEMGYGGTLDENNTLNEYPSISTVSAWSGPYVNLKKLMAETDLKIGDEVTYSIYFKTNFTPISNMSFTAYRFASNGGDKNFSIPKGSVKPNEWMRISVTFTLTEYSTTSTGARLETDYWDTSDPYYFGNNRTNKVYFACPQLEKGSVMTNWTASKQYTSQFVINEPLRSLPNGVKDIAYIKNNKLYVDRYVGSVVLNGSETWSTYNNQFYTLRKDKLSANLNIPAYSTNLMCDYFKAVNHSVTTTSIGTIYSGTNNLNFNFDDGADGVDNFKTWLSTHNMQLDYELETPVTEEYGEVDYPITYKNITNIATTDNVEPNMNITYVREGSMTDYIAGQFTEKDIVQSRKFSELSVKADSISASVTSVEGDLSETNSKVNSLETQITSQEATIKIVETHINKDDGTMAANEVTTSNGFTFNSDGLNIYVGENSYNTQINNIGTFYRDGDEIIGQTSKDGSILKDLKTQGQSQYSYDGDSYDFIEERVEVDGEYCYATFYNGEE